MVGRGRGGRGFRGSRGAAQPTPSVRTPQLCMQPHQEESQAQPTTPTSRRPLSSAASCSIAKNVRGSYKCISVDSKTKNGQKIQIEIPDDILRAVGAGSREIVNYIGHITRCTCPLRERDWTKIWERCGDQILLKVKENFKVGASMASRFDALIVATAQRSYKTWRSRLHNFYAKYNTDEERLAHTPPAVNDDEWKHLVSYFGSEEFKGKSSINAQNRAKLTTKHTCGSRSFAEVEESTRNVETGEKAPVDEIWQMQHTRKTKDGELIWSDAKSQEFHSRLQEIVTKQLHEEATVLSNEEILTQVLGQRTGYVRGKGYGVRPPSKKTSAQITPQYLQEQKRKIREEVAAELREEMHEEMKLREERMHATLQAQLQAQFEERLQAQMTSLITSLQQGQILIAPTGSAVPSSTSNVAPVSPNEPPN